MPKDIINPSSLARPIGFSHGILTTAGRLLFLAGQTGSDAEGHITAPGNLVAQYEQAMRNLQAVVLSAGGTMQDITRLNIFVRDRDDYLAHLKPLGQVHRAFFGPYYPAMALFEISRLFQDDALVEVEGMAVIE
jgi:enamine deaminase RidA (YjgF/YER057c/UK114 family)